MTYLYEHRDQLEELRRLAEIAYKVTYQTPFPDRDDLEQEIVVTLMKAIARGKTANAYLWKVARCVRKEYWWKKSQERIRLCPLYEDSGDDEDDGQEMAPTREDLDIESRLDALAVIATLPKRLVEIGYKRLNGEKLSPAEKLYWSKTKKKFASVRPGHRKGCHLSDLDKRRIERLYAGGLTVGKIARTMSSNPTTVRLYLVERGLRDTQEVPAPIREWRRNRATRSEHPDAVGVTGL